MCTESNRYLLIYSRTSSGRPREIQWYPCLPLGEGPPSPGGVAGGQGEETALLFSAAPYLLSFEPGIYC